MIAKLLYSALLIALTAFAGVELYRVWLDPRLYIGRFDYASTEETTGDKGQAFALQVGLAHALLFRHLQDFNQRGQEGTSDTTYDLSAKDQLGAMEDGLAKLEVTYQDVDVGKLLASLRKALRQPNEVTGAVTKVDGIVRATVSWPQAPMVGGKAERAFHTEARSTDGGAARQVACGIAFAQIADRSPRIADLGRPRFCQWVDVLSGFSAFSTKQTETGIVDDDAPGILNLRRQLNGLFTMGDRFPDVYRLRADLTDLLPAKDRRPLLAESQNDRLTYAMLTDPTLKALPVADRRLRAFAIARPAILLEGDKLTDVRENWRSELTPNATAISRASASVGVLRSDDSYVATAFRIGKGLIVTVRFALIGGSPPIGAETDRRPASGDPRIAGMSFCSTDDATTPCSEGHSFPIKEVVYDGEKDGSYLAILRIDDSGPSPRLDFRDGEAADSALIDAYAYIIGYPTNSGGGVPPVVMNELIGDRPGRKRLLPGRTLGFETDVAVSGVPVGAQLTTDINTAPGTAGAPLIDLATGRVIGVHIGGRWDEERGKFTYAEVVTKDLIAKLQAALAPKPAPTPRPPPPAPVAPVAPLPE
ncbi:MAG: trypsin-like peptidase domain-containing protein [Phenylobacterium sp.]|uniref:trypsin-like peptidase domain-containing protein n=1 Tax=Phenylobacterium sp. TaxID=1871053 RepID=UPI0027371D23|nr:trypsin-like peptidase domain-containing protein [Phenylobacterium sp.]MDP3747196.1 trypsin-like peptidase domain-containing protein [Phenylobacterium sp.]